MLVRDGAGNYFLVTPTNNTKIKRVAFTQCGLTTRPRGQSNKIKQSEVCSKYISYIPKNVEGGRFDDDSRAYTCLIGQGFRLINTHAYECKVSGFSNLLGLLKVQVVGAVTVATTGEDKELIV